MLKINHIQHIGIPVTAINVSVSFYNRLGFNNVMEASFDQNGKAGKCIMMQRDTMIMELYQLPASSLAEIRSRKDGHIDHIAFDVPDIDETYDYLKREGFNILEDQPILLQFWSKGCKYFNITGPDGERLEFNQVL